MKNGIYLSKTGNRVIVSDLAIGGYSKISYPDRPGSQYFFIRAGLAKILLSQYKYVGVFQ